MANYTSTANVVLTLNGQQAKQTMAKLQQEAAQLEKKIAAAAQAGDKATMKKLQRELNNTNGMINQLRGSAATTEQVLKRLDKATPKELNKALKQLKAQLNNIERGSKAWDEHQKKIKAVQDEIAKINNAPKEVQTLQQRIGGWWDKLAMKIAAATAAVAGFVAATKKAVAAYASMQAEEAGVSKYTGMSAEDVKELNDAFKQMETRTTREDLNRLAQDAGRLGKQSVEDVLGFVRAADKVNVALDDLGDGATLTLSKLTDVFGDEKRYGTEQSLLKVGSVINDLSQSCSASAPYIADFMSRLGGVGSLSGFTASQIAAFGAVLDSQAQGLEVSTTALQQLIVRLMQDPAKYAKVAGMDVKKFSDLIKTDMNGALLMFLESLNKTGRMDELAKMFKDMGENGQGSVNALATLAKNLDMVREKQAEAAESFRLGTSVTKEAAQANSTVQSQLDIQQKKLTELWVILGDRLLPVQLLMNKAQYASVQAMVKVVEFAVKYRREIITVATAVGVYTVAANAAAIKTKLFTAAQTAGKVIATAYRLTLIGTQAVYALITGNATRAAAATRAFNAACAANPYGIALAALTLLIGGIISYVSRTNEAAEETAKLQKKQEDWERSLEDVSKRAQDSAAKEISQLEMLYKVATDVSKSTDQRRIASEKLQRLYPSMFANYTTEQIMVGKAAKAYDDLRESIMKAAKARAAEDMMADTNKELWLLTETEPKLRQKVAKAKADYDAAVAARHNEENTYTRDAVTRHAQTIARLKREWEEAQGQLNLNINRQSAKRKIIGKLSDMAAESLPDTSTEQETVTDTGSGAGTGSGYSPAYLKKQQDRERRAAEAAKRRAETKAKKEFKEQLDQKKGEWESGSATNLSDYKTGKKDYEKYLQDKYNLDIKYVTDRMKVYEEANITEDEDYQELVKKKAETEAKWLDGSVARKVETLKRQQKIDEQQAEIDSMTPGDSLFGNETAKQERLFKIRKNYLSLIRDCYITGSEEYAAAERALAQNAADYKLDTEKRMYDEMIRIRSKYPELDAKTRYDAELKVLQALRKADKISKEIYERETTDLINKYIYDLLPEEARDRKTEEQSNEEQKAKALSALDAQYANGKGLMTEKQYLKAKDNIEQYYADKAKNRARDVHQTEADLLINLVESFQAVFSGLDGDMGNKLEKIGKLAAAVTATMGAVFQQTGEYMQACADLEVAETEKRFKAQIEAAEGNSAKQKQLEKAKEAEIAKIKNDVRKKQFAMQVALAIAQTAQNAITAYGAGLQVGGPAGLVLGPIAAALATASGLVQIATMRKQQQASEAQGFSRGGFTKPGAVDEPAGVVHAGEWVASQKLVNNPRARQIINALDYAQRTNTIGSLRMADVSRSITAPMAIASGSSAPVVVQAPAPQVVVQESPELAASLATLNRRLSEPFVTVNTVTGTHGMQAAQDEYARLMRNKSPKTSR